MILLLVLAADRTFTAVVAVTEVSAVAVPAIPEIRPERANADATTTVLRVVLTCGSVHRSGSSDSGWCTVRTSRHVSNNNPR